MEMDAKHGGLKRSVVGGGAARTVPQARAGLFLALWSMKSRGPDDLIE